MGAKSSVVVCTIVDVMSCRSLSIKRQINSALRVASRSPPEFLTQRVPGVFLDAHISQKTVGHYFLHPVLQVISRSTSSAT